MRPSQRTCLLAAALLCALGAPRLAHAVNGCTNAYLSGAYNAQVNSANINSIVNATSGATTPPDAQALGNNPSSLSGQMAALGRYYFDRNGNVFGLGPKATTANPLIGVIGTYSVNTDCSGKISLTNGRTFDIVVSSSGDRVVFLETDANGGGAIGTMAHTVNSCVSTNAASFSYSLSGALMAPPSANSTGTAPAATLQGFSAIGILSIDGAGHFKISQSSYNNGAYQPQTAAGTYSVAANCALSLTFNTTGNTGGFGAPAGFAALLNETDARATSNSAGLFMLQPVTGQTLTGQIFLQ